MHTNKLLEDLYSSNFTVFLGNFGRGKSISLTYLAIMSALLNKRKVIMGNMPLFNLNSFGIEFVPLISTSQFTENMKDIEIVMDELHKIANSRKSLSPENSFTTEFSTDVRKFNQGIVGTAQFNNTYDIRLCDNTEVNIAPEWRISQKTDRTDFNIYWNLFFLDDGINEIITLNLDKIKDYYNTNFKPFKLVVNHEEYIDNLREHHKEDYVEKYINKCNKQITKVENTYKEMLRGKE